MCDMQNCDREITHPKLGLCNSCYSVLLYWQKKNQKAVIERAMKLQLFQERMDLIIPSNVKYKPYRMNPSPIEILPGQYKKYHKPGKRRLTNKKRNVA